MGPRARRRFGQHFLADRSVIAAIVAAIAPRPGDLLVEIGPGRGALTRPLAERLAHLHAVEIDRDLVAELRAAFPPERVTIHQADALRFDFGALGEGLRVAGNLPYNISTALLFHLARHAACIRDLHLMLQKEVVERMVAAPGTAAYGRLSVMLQYRFSMERVLTVAPGAFRPPPRVESALVRMVPLAQPRPAARDEALFERLVRAAFAQRRKTLRNALAALVGAHELARIGIDPGRRAQELSVEEFVRLANALAAGAAESGQCLR
jgi:16S rRNA (adenine1518-N6/adenine1519-N6)-dimethyltransferase